MRSLPIVLIAVSALLACSDTETAVGPPKLQEVSAEGTTTAVVQVFTDRAAFLAAVDLNVTIDFEDFPPNARHIPFDGTEYADMGVVFRSPLPLPDGQLYVESQAHSSNYLSIDQPPGQPPRNHDDLYFDVRTRAFAFGVDIVDPGGSVGEAIVVSGETGRVYVHDKIPSFFGIISSEPIVEVYFDENPSDVDDIGYDDAMIGNAAQREFTVFVTRQGFTGNLGGLAGADEACQAAADAAGIGRSRTYGAWLSSSTTR
jgi:hypothetical protein